MDMNSKSFESALARHERRHDLLMRSGGRIYGQPLDASHCGPGTISVHGSDLIDLTSYDYLGLNRHPEILGAAIRALEESGTGATGVRLLSGTRGVHSELEAAIAQFVGQEASITTASGCSANQALVSTFARNGYHVFSDKHNHASIHDACSMVPEQCFRYRHNDLDDLESQLASSQSEDKLVITDAIFSTTGEVARLPELLDLCREHGGTLAVDEAHSLGTLGTSGRGIAEHFRVDPLEFIHIGTLSKAIPSIGGFVAWSARVINFMRFHAGPYVFSAALPPTNAATALAALRVILEEPQRLDRLRSNSRQFRVQLAASGVSSPGRVESPIISLNAGGEQAAWTLARRCHENGVFVLPMAHPAVPRGKSVLRLVVTCEHTEIQLARAAQIVASNLRRAA